MVPGQAEQDDARVHDKRSVLDTAAVLLMVPGQAEQDDARVQDGALVVDNTAQDGLRRRGGGGGGAGGNCISIMVNVPDSWCIDSCQRSHCPDSVCKCEKGYEAPPAWAQSPAAALVPAGIEPDGSRPADGSR